MDLNDLISASISRIEAKKSGKAADLSDYRNRAEHLKNLFPELKVTLTGSWIWVTGNTFPFRDALKMQGCKWSANKKAWYLKGESSGYFKRGQSYSLDYITDKYGQEEIQLAN